MSSATKRDDMSLKSSIEKDQVYNMADWLRKSKDFLRQKCLRYGLPSFGKKTRLAQRLISYLHQPSFSISASSASSDMVVLEGPSTSLGATTSQPASRNAAPREVHNIAEEARANTTTTNGAPQASQLQTSACNLTCAVGVTPMEGQSIPAHPLRRASTNNGLIASSTPGTP